jgi:SAM-dependent methyltransferase
MYDLSEEEFMKVNASFHHSFLKDTHCSDDPNWLLRLKKQSIELFKLFKAGIVPSELLWLDYACGNGSLIKHLQDLGCSNIVGYEPYMNDVVLSRIPLITEKALQPGKFDCVISTSFLEHVRDLTVIDRMCELVSPNGVFIFHTFVDEQIPADPNWFYLLPTHCSFFTDDALAILFEKYGFKSATHIPRGNIHVWSRVDVPGFVKGRPEKYRAE